jgi:hypothetical protein
MLQSDRAMQLTLIPCEVYDTRSDAVQALATDVGQPAAERPSTKLPPLVMEDVSGVTCLTYDCRTWTDNVGAMQPLLRSLVTDLGRDRVVLVFSGQSIVGTPTMACIYSLWKALSRAGGRFAMCHLNRDLLEFFRWHDRGRLAFPGRES